MQTRPAIAKCGALATCAYKPDHFIIECNKACTCDISCCRRKLQRGCAHQLQESRSSACVEGVLTSRLGWVRLWQVFKTQHKGWCVRTVGAINEGDFIFEFAREDLHIILNSYTLSDGTLSPWQVRW